MIWFWILFALYSTGLIFVWGFFLIARIHVYKFKQYSTHIVPVTKLVFFVLLALTIVGYYVVLSEMNTAPAPKTVQETSIQETY